MTQPLTLGCDCVGVVQYLDATLANEQGAPWVIANAICIHEEDYGILWKHVDLLGGRSEVRRSRRLVVSFVSTVGNYEYGFFWYFYLDGNIQLEVKLTGIVSPMAIEPGTVPEFANVVGEGRRRAAPPAPVQRSPRLRRRRFRERRARGRGRAGAARPGQPVGQRVPAEVDPSRSRDRSASRHGRRDLAGVAHLEPRRAQRARAAGRVPAPPDDVDADDAGRARFVGRAARRLRAAQPLGDALRARRAAGRGRVPEPARGRRRPSRVDRGRPFDRGHRHRLLVHVRRDALRAPGGLAGHAGRVLRLPPEPRRLLRPQPTLDLPEELRALTAQPPDRSANPTETVEHDGRLDPRRTATRARQLHRDRGGVGPHRRLGPVGRAVHRGRRVRRAPLRHVPRPGRDPGVDHRDDGAVAELGDDRIPARLVRVRRRTRLVDLPDREPVPRSG